MILQTAKSSPPQLVVNEEGQGDPRHRINGKSPRLNDEVCRCQHWNRKHGGKQEYSTRTKHYAMQPLRSQVDDCVPPEAAHGRRRLLSFDPHYLSLLSEIRTTVPAKVLSDGQRNSAVRTVVECYVDFALR
jgi:hypothetical protein